VAAETGPRFRSCKILHDSALHIKKSIIQCGKKWKILTVIPNTAIAAIAECNCVSVVRTSGRQLPIGAAALGDKREAFAEK
jgi:hypothetical protein